MTHPNAIDLEAFACGEASQVKSHVDGCDACTAYVAKARAQAPRLNVAPFLATARRRERQRRVLFVTGVATPLAIAAAALLFVRSAAPTASATPPASSPKMALLMAPTDPDTTFKGGFELAVVRERGQAQNRYTTAVSVKPGDRLRIEVALDRPQDILGAVMGDDGTFVELMPQGVREAGTHFSEKSVRVDAPATSGTVVVGPPDAVHRALATRQLRGLRTLRVELEGP
jgi:hypothetical protein